MYIHTCVNEELQNRNALTKRYYRFERTHRLFSFRSVYNSLRNHRPRIRALKSRKKNKNQTLLIRK